YTPQQMVRSSSSLPPGSSTARAAGPPRPRRTGPHRQQHGERIGRLRDRVFDGDGAGCSATAAEPGAAAGRSGASGSGAGRAADRHAGGRGQRRNVSPVPGRHRSDRRGHLQLAVARGVSPGLSWHGERVARRFDDRRPQTVRSHPSMSPSVPNPSTPSPRGPGYGLSPNLHHLETSATIAISQEAKRRNAAGEDVIDLGAGEPGFPTPPIPAGAGVRALRARKTPYA